MAICCRCKTEIAPGEEEACFYCEGWLCYDCWEEYGHCGHPEADEMNKRAQESREARERRLDRGGDVWEESQQEQNQQ